QRHVNVRREAVLVRIERQPLPGDGDHTVIGKQHVVVSLDDHIDHLSGVGIDQHILDVADLFTGGVLEIVQVVVGQLVVEQILVNQGGQTQEVTGAGVQPQAGGVNDAATGVQRADVEGRRH